VTFSEEEQKKSRLTVAEKLEHFLEVRENLRIAMAKKDLGEMPEKRKKYEAYGATKKG